MGAAISLREDFSSADLHDFSKASKDADQTRRLLALAAIHDGARRIEAARIGGVGRQVIRDWVVRFNAHGPQGLIDGKAKGKPPKLNDTQRQALADIVEQGPVPAVDDVVRWRLIDLKQWIWEEFSISLHKSSVSRELRALGFVKMTARPRHQGQNEFVLEDFKKTSVASWWRSPRALPPARK